MLGSEVLESNPLGQRFKMFFHNGVSTGLAISKASKGIDTSWILFNKPQDLTNRHAGF
jgi:hypothetical protein